MKILLVLTSHGQLGDTCNPTGFWLEELAAPYYVFKDAGAELVLASPKGGQPPLHPKSDETDAQTDATRRFRADRAAMFYPGSHGPFLWGLAESQDSSRIPPRWPTAPRPCCKCCKLA